LAWISSGKNEIEWPTGTHHNLKWWKSAQNGVKIVGISLYLAWYDSVASFTPSREERAFFRSEAEAMGAEVELRYLDVGLEELWARLSERNANLPPGTFAVTREELELWWSWFERPFPLQNML
jgi:hypothetical protein